MIDVATLLAGMIAGGGIAFVAARRRTSRTAPAAEPPAHDRRKGDDAAIVRVLHGLPFAAFIFDTDGRLTFVNDAAETLFEIRAERAQGRALIEVVPSVDFERQMLAALAGTSSTRDVSVIDGDRERIFGITAKPLGAEGAMAIAADRTALVSIDRVRRDFIGNVSHELRTPLAAIKLMVETVLASDDDAEARAMFLPRVSREVDRMVQLVEDLLELARSESGRLTLRREVFDLTDVAAAVVNTFARRADILAVELDLDAPDPVFVDADPARMTQVAMNLLDNALRHTPSRGCVRVTVVRDGATAVMRVSDTGVGIPYNDLPHIFERFYVVDRSRSRGQGGTGLGLSIARHLVEAHGGTIEAESVFGRGATFDCRIPLAADIVTGEG